MVGSDFGLTSKGDSGLDKQLKTRRSSSVRQAEQAMTDVKFALRSFTKSPGFTLLAVAIMAVGIGANTAVFTVLNTVLLKPLSVQGPGPDSLPSLV